MSTMNSIPVLWPDDITGEGFIYGWLSPFVCVAGLLPEETLPAATAALDRYYHLGDWGSFVRLCGSFPTIIGCFHVDAGIPKLELLDMSTADFHLVQYTRPNLQNMQMYALDLDVFVQVHHTINEEPLARERGDLCGWYELDFTHPTCSRHSVLNQRVVHQINLGQAIIRAVPPSMPLLHYTGEVMVPPSLSPWIAGLTAPTGGGSAKTSALFAQMATRYSQLRWLYEHCPPPRYTVSSDAVSSYIGFHNCLWLILNDLIIGIAVGTYIREHSRYLSKLLRFWLERILIEDIQQILIWLDNWPAGLKLNTELSALCCQSLLFVLTGWNRFLTLILLPHLDGLVYLSGALGCLGMTITATFLSDILTLLTAHLHLCYMLSLVIYRQQLRSADSLWKLFQGRRTNTLRQRTDSWVFDMDQLMFGTILFTLLAFICPTTTAYYILFSSIRVLALLLYMAIDMLLLLINHFPLFAFMLHLKDPLRLPSGLLFALPSKNHLHVCIKQDLTFRILTNTLMIRTIHCIYLIFSANVMPIAWC